MKSLPDFSYEIPLWEKGLSVLGIDEAGRGAFAGPLSVGGVIFDTALIDKLLKLGINDSKLLSAKKREVLYHEIKKHAIFSHVELISHEIINEVGIGKATFLGMENVYKKGLEKFGNIHGLIDAFKIPKVVSQTAIVHGDRKSISIAAASILAKVERDHVMENLSQLFPEYGFATHKGYGTLMHRNILGKIGPTAHHRTQFIRRFV